MPGSAFELEWRVTEEKVTELVRAIVSFAQPLQVIAFGSRARGDQREDSDLDLAVILAEDDPKMAGRLYAGPLAQSRMVVDLAVASRAEFDLYRASLNSVFNYIDREGVILYDAQDQRSLRAEAVRTVGRGRIGAAAPAA